MEDFLHVAVDDVRDQDQAGVVVARYGTYDMYVTAPYDSLVCTACTHAGSPATSGLRLSVRACHSVMKPEHFTRRVLDCLWKAQPSAVASRTQQARSPETTHALPKLSM